MNKLSFHGAAGTVTGSCFLLTSDSARVLIDCGLFQGSKELEDQNGMPFGFNPSELTGVLLTHAHLDHCGRLPKLVKEGFTGPIYMTQATHALLEIALPDAARVMASHPEHVPIYEQEHVEKTLSLSKIIEYDTAFSFSGYEITYVNAGHILGSASILMKGNGITYAFSGDLGNSPQDIIQPTEFLSEADVVIMESTYGDRLHPTDDPVTILKSEIEEVERAGGTLLIPAFSLERTQELLHKIDHLKRQDDVKAETPVFMDSPMAIHATEVFRKFTELYNREMVEHLKVDDPFAFPGLQVIYRDKDSKSLKDIPGTKVIIAGSGMMTGGRIVSHAKTFLPLPSTRILFVGYQGEHTLGREILGGAKQVKIDGEEVTVAAHVSETQAMSSHADQKGLHTWINHIKKVKKLFLVHGEEEPRKALAELISSDRPELEMHFPHKSDVVEV